MTEIIDSLSHPALGKAAEINYQNALGILGRLIAATFHYELGTTWFVHDLIGLNMVATTQITADTPESEIDEMLKRIAVSSEAPITWNIGPSMHNTRLENRLQANAWLKTGELPALVMDLHHLDTQLEKNPSGLSIELIDNDEALKQHMNIMAVGFEFPEPIVNYISNLHLSHEFLEDTDIRYYLGRVDGKPVAIAVLFLSGGVAGIYNIATVPQMRHQGIGRAMTLAPLRDAHRLGYPVAVIQASSMGINLYRQLGFEDHFAFDTYSSRKDAGQ